MSNSYKEYASKDIVYLKDEVYTKEETDQRIQEAIEACYAQGYEAGLAAVSTELLGGKW